MGEGNPIYTNGLYFALQSGVEHHNIHNNPCQIQETLFDVHMLKTFLKNILETKGKKMKRYRQSREMFCSSLKK